MNDNKLRLVAFDADDTLWDCQTHFDNVEQQYYRLLSPWMNAEEAAEEFFQTEKANMPILGFGAKAFTISLVENAVQVSRGEISAATILQIVDLGKGLLNMPATPLPGVRQALARLCSVKMNKGFRMVVFTKGELQDQENKLRRSGLQNYFDGVVIVSDKTEQAYRKLCSQYGVSTGEMMMIGNSFKSDIDPALRVGASAIHVPYHTMWRMESAEVYTHNRLTEVDSIADVPEVVESMC